jgi:hypothetical protein
VGIQPFEDEVLILLGEERGADREAGLVVGVLGLVIVELEEVVSEVGIVADNLVVNEIPSKRGRSDGGVLFGIAFNLEGPFVEGLGVPHAQHQLQKDCANHNC